MATTDLELGAATVQIPQAVPPKPVAGYPALAQFMGKIPESAIFRRFGALTALDLLYRQAELMLFEERLRKEQERDSESTTEAQNSFALDWYMLADQGSGTDRRQWQMVLQMRPKLKEYKELLNLAYDTAKLPEPRKYDLRHLQRFLKSDEMGEYGLGGVDGDIYGSKADLGPYAHDLASLRLRHAEDIFSVWVSESFLLRWYRCVGHRFKRPDPHTGLIGYKDKQILRVTYAISSCVAASLPTASVIVLYFIGSMMARLVAVALFTCTFALAMKLFSAAKTSEMFAATAAYAAVQVVFVSASQSAG